MRKLIFFPLILFLMMLACNAPGSVPALAPTVASGSVPPPADAGSSAPGGAPAAPAVCTPLPLEPTLPPPTATATSMPSEPMSMRKGLASLNSYVLVVRTVGASSTSPDQTLSNIEVQSSQDLDAMLMHVTMTMPEEGEEPSQTDTFTYSIGNDQCAGNDEDGWEFQTFTAQEKETQDILTQMMDLLPLIDDPVFVGPETMNGVAANHFTFQVSGIGSGSGVDVAANQGEYWLAQDGQYLVRYTLLIETVDPNTQEVLHAEYLIDLTSINQPLSIAFPQACLDAKNNP